MSHVHVIIRSTCQLESTWSSMSANAIRTRQRQSARASRSRGGCGGLPGRASSAIAQEHPERRRPGCLLRCLRARGAGCGTGLGAAPGGRQPVADGTDRGDLTMVFVDTNVFVYAVGRPHPLCEEAQRMLRDRVSAGVPLATSAEVLQELLNIYLPVGRLTTLDAALRLVADLVTVWPVEASDVLAARDLATSQPTLGARDLLHLAVCRRRAAAGLLTSSTAGWRLPSRAHADRCRHRSSSGDDTTFRAGGQGHNGRACHGAEDVARGPIGFDPSPTGSPGPQVPRPPRHHATAPPRPQVPRSPGPQVPRPARDLTRGSPRVAPGRGHSAAGRGIRRPNEAVHATFETRAAPLHRNSPLCGAPDTRTGPRTGAYSGHGRPAVVSPAGRRSSGPSPSSGYPRSRRPAGRRRPLVHGTPCTRHPLYTAPLVHGTPCRRHPRTMTPPDGDTPDWRAGCNGPPSTAALECGRRVRQSVSAASSFPSGGSGSFRSSAPRSRQCVPQARHTIPSRPERFQVTHADELRVGLHTEHVDLRRLVQGQLVLPADGAGHLGTARLVRCRHRSLRCCIASCCIASCWIASVASRPQYALPRTRVPGPGQYYRASVMGVPV